jgi:hypothetical protein
MSATEFGEGPLSRAAAFVYTLVMIELLFLLCSAPGLLLVLLLSRDASNIPLAAAFALPVGPALSAALYALHQRRSGLADLTPGPAFWRGYRLNAVAALKVWVPWLVWVAILGVSLANIDAAGVPAWWGILLALILVGATLWEANALVIASLFTFRGRDVARLAVYFLSRTKGATLANLCLLIVAAALTAYASEVVVILVGSVLALTLLYNSRQMISDIRREFTA